MKNDSEKCIQKKSWKKLYRVFTFELSRTFLSRSPSILSVTRREEMYKSRNKGMYFHNFHESLLQ